jgi:virginiamycin A acetyltransferase
MKGDSFIAPESTVVECEYGEHVKIYRWADLRESRLGAHVQIGDHSVLIKSVLESNIAINRRNFIQESRIGRFTYTGFNTVIRGSSVGRFCSISWNVSIGGKDHPDDRVTTSTLWAFNNMNGTKDSRGFKYGEIGSDCVLGNDVLVSANAVVLRDVTVGHGSVIGAGAVVTKNVDPFTVVAGVPAKPIRKRFSAHIVDALLEIKWWDWPVPVIRENLDLIYSTKVDEHVIERLRAIAKTL